MHRSPNPTRFVILCHARTGSTLFGDLLGSHPSVYWDDEHLRTLQQKRANSLTYLAGRVARHFPSAYLYARATWRGMPVYGCKLAVYYAYPAQQLLHSLHRRGWLILYLWRRDLVRETISGCVAKAHRHRKSFHASRDRAAQPMLYVEPERFLQSLAKRALIQAQERQTLAGLPYLEFVYEDDLADASRWEATTARVFAALELPQHPVATSVHKTWQQPYSEIVANYAELMETGYAHLAGEKHRLQPANTAE